MYLVTFIFITEYPSPYRSNILPDASRGIRSQSTRHNPHGAKATDEVPPSAGQMFYYDNIQ